MERQQPGTSRLELIVFRLIFIDFPPLEMNCSQITRKEAPGFVYLRVIFFFFPVLFS